MSTPMIHQLDAEKVRVEQSIRELQTKREKLALDVVRQKVKPGVVEKIDDELQKAERDLKLIASARAAAQVEAEEAAVAESVERLRGHVVGAVEMGEARVAAARQVDRALDSLRLSLASAAQLGAGCWSRLTQADAEVQWGRVSEGVLAAHGLAHGSLGPLLAGLLKLLEAEPRLKPFVAISGVTTPQPTAEARAKDELERLRAVLAVHCSPEAHSAARESAHGRSRVAANV